MSILALVDAENWQAILDQYDTGCDIPPDDDPYWFDIADKDYFERGILAIIKIAREHVAPPPADPLARYWRECYGEPGAAE